MSRNPLHRLGADPHGAESGPDPTAGSFEALDADEDSYLDGDEMAEWVDDEGVFSAWDIDPDYQDWDPLHLPALAVESGEVISTP